MQQNAYGATDGAMDEVDAYFRLLWGLLAVLGVMLILYALLKKRFSVLNVRGNSAIKVIEMRPLMPKKSLCLVEVGGCQYLLGLSADRITLIAELQQSKKNSFSEVFEQTRDR